MTLNVKSRLGDYKVNFSRDFSFIENLRALENCIFIIDKNVYKIYKNILNIDLLPEDILLFDAVEENKTIESVCAIYERLTNRKAKRNTILVSIGGGITQDVTGFVASTIYRGIKWIFVPTTFLAQTDSCIGSKTSLNFKSFKNIVGSFYPPCEIFICPKFIDTLSEVDFYSGLGEAIKLKLMKTDKEFDINTIKKDIEETKNKDHDALYDIILDNLKTKLSYIENDEFDTGKRNLLNYGHCFGHALETASNYSVPHGIAVLIGIVFANSISMKRGILSKDIYQCINDQLCKRNICIELKLEYFKPNKLITAMKNDKKRIGTDLTIILPDDKMHLHKVSDMSESEFNYGLEETLKQLL